MPTTPRIVIDGLWRCLCPSIDAAFLARPASLALPLSLFPRASPHPRPRHRHRPSPRWVCQARAAHTDSRNSTPRPPTPAPLTDPVADPDNAESNATNDIYQKLRVLRQQPGQAGEIRRLVQLLLKDRREPPNIFLYDALIVANWDPQGSAEELWQILDDMARNKIPPSIGLYHSALRALAVHPNYVLRNRILRSLSRVRGESLTPDARVSVALGLLRDGQYEMALDYLDGIAAPVPGWVYEIFIFVLGRRGFVREAVQILARRDVASPAAWYFLLDECSKCLHYPGTKLVWDRMVEPGALNPSDGMATNVLNTAARYGDADLATQAIQHLSARRVKLGMHHYEALVECYTRRRDLENAFLVLCIMGAAGTRPEPASTRPIFALLWRSRELRDSAMGLLSGLNKNHEIPEAALHVLIEAMCDQGEADAALELCRQDFRRLCPSGPTLYTFELLLSKPVSAETASSVILEMQASYVTPSPAIHRALVRSFALAGDVESSLRSVAEMDVAGSAWLDKPTLLALLESCFTKEDPRAWDIVDEAKGRGLDVEREVGGMLEKIAKAQRVGLSRTAAAP